MSKYKLNATVDILLVDDDPDDLWLMKRAFDRVVHGHTLHCAGCGETAMSFLNKQSGHENAPTPNLVILDLNMPRMSGFDILKATQTIVSLKPVPFVVLTTCTDPNTAESVLELGAAAFHSKPGSVLKLEQLVRHMLMRWCCSGSVQAETA